MTSPADAPPPALGELARLAKAATPGPWKATSAFPIWRTIASLGSTETGAWWVAHDDAYAKHTNGAKADAEFIAACSPAVILQLVALASGGAETGDEFHAYTLLLDKYLDSYRDAVEAESGAGPHAPGDPETDRAYERASIRRAKLDAYVAQRLRALTPERPADA